MKLPRWLKQWLRPEPDNDVDIDNVGFKKIMYQGKEMQRDTTAQTVVVNELDIVTHRPGGVRKTKHKQYKLDDHPHGGRVVKTMPKQLRHMKELAEKTDE